MFRKLRFASVDPPSQLLLKAAFYGTPDGHRPVALTSQTPPPSRRVRHILPDFQAGKTVL